MTVFYLTLLSVYIFSLLARITRKNNKKAGVFFLIIIMAILVIVSGLRNGIGDTGMYKHSYNIVANSDTLPGGYEVGFLIYFKILTYFSNDPQFMIFITSLIINILNCISIYKYTKNSYFELAMFLYVASGYYTVTMNGIRQSLAAAIIFLATSLIINRKFKTYCLLILLMITIHNSAFVMIPIYFIAKEKPWEKKTNILYIVMLIGLFFYQPIMFLLGDSKYGDYANSTEGGANIIRVIIFMVPVVLAYLKRKEINEKWKEGNVFINMSIICSIIMMFSLYNWIFARFTIYLELANFIVLSYLISNCFKGKERRLIYFSLLVCYFIFFYYEHVISLGIIYTTDFNLSSFLYY